MANSKKDTAAQPSMEELVAQLKAENEQLKAEKDQQGRQAAELLEGLQQQVRGGGPIITPRFEEVPGVFSASYTDPNTGEAVERTVKFKLNQLGVRVPGGIVVSSASLMKLANGEPLSEQELAASPALSGWSSQKASDYLTDLVKKGSSQLEPVG